MGHSVGLAIGTAQQWYTASPSLPAVVLLSGLLLGCHTNKATCPSPAHPLGQHNVGSGRAGASQPLPGVTAPLSTAMPPSAMGTWVYKGGCLGVQTHGVRAQPMVAGGMDVGAHGNMDTPLDGPSQHGHTGRDRQMDSWMLRLAVPPPPPQCLGTARPCSVAPRGGPKPVLGDKKPHLASR